jgi:hypothetical protein
MSVFWWIVLGVFIACSVYILWWMYKVYIAIRCLVQAVRELYFAIRKQLDK